MSDGSNPANEGSGDKVGASDSEEDSLDDLSLSDSDISGSLVCSNDEDSADDGDLDDEQDYDEDDNEEAKHPLVDGSRNVPLNVKFKSQVNDISAHPSRNLFAAGQINGKVSLHSFSVHESNKKLLEYDGNKSSCRALSFFNQGKTLLSTFKNKTIRLTDIETGTGVKNINNAHSSPLYSLKELSEHLFATGDEAGCVKVWDSRTCSPIVECKENTDFISDMSYVSDKKMLLCTCGDGTLSAISIGKKKLERRSDQLDEELLSVATVKEAGKVVCGGGDGTLHIYSWGLWADVSDRFPGHPSSIDALCAIGDDTLCTGCADGNIRIVRIQPNAFVGILGGHGDFPVERIRPSFDGAFALSCSHDNLVKFWNVAAATAQQEGNDVTTETGPSHGATKPSRKRKLQETREQGVEFFSDL